MDPERMRSVQEVESNMPPLRGENADFHKHVEYTDVHQQQLQEYAAITGASCGLEGLVDMGAANEQPPPVQQQVAAPTPQHAVAAATATQRAAAARSKRQKLKEEKAYRGSTCISTTLSKKTSTMLAGETAAPVKSTKPKGPAPYRHEDLILIPTIVPEIVARTWTNNKEEWAKGVPLAQYHARERHLANTPFSSDNRLVTWILVPKSDAEVTAEYRESTDFAKTPAEGVRGGFEPEDVSIANLERIMGAVETYERPGMIATAGDETGLKDVTSMSVASVFVPSKYRNHSYGKLIMKLLWEEIGNRGASFSYLYSDLGSQFYTNFGWTARTSVEIIIPPSLALPLAPNVAFEAVKDDDDEQSLKRLIEHDAQMVRETVKQKVHEATLANASTTFVASTPEIRCFQWLYARSWFNASNVWKLNETQIKEGLNYGVYVPGTLNQFMLWHHDFTDDNLFILRWRIDSTSNSEESDAIALTFIQAAQQEAKKWNLSKIVYWDENTALAKLLGLEVKERHHSISSLGLVRSSQDERNVEWILNEKWSW
ncbi:hypothetical protein BGZ65_001942 [Modicella reniformis]|uniref:LYC1 C-terminal domain-containing protein n=1 Tax=Modicella reniformis TaxID=1440133 RepID=A0A9P6M9V7_9FUNG|nr:hypothetical protein BGZ65_001942 [Modicella reniformis]